MRFSAAAYPMNWKDNNDGTDEACEIYLVLLTPSCALTLLVKIALHDVGGQRPNLFNSMPHRHAVFEHSGLSLDGDKQGIFTTYT